MLVYSHYNKLPQMAQGHIFVCFDPAFLSHLYPPIECNHLKGFISVTVGYFMLLHFASCVSLSSPLTVLGFIFRSFRRFDRLLRHSPCIASTQKRLSLYCKGTAILNKAPAKNNNASMLLSETCKYLLCFKIWCDIVKQSVLRTYIGVLKCVFGLQEFRYLA